MRILTFQGKYGYRKQETFSGLVCFLHFEEKDTIKTTEKATVKLIELAQSNSIILVPFAHLFEAVANTETAHTLFNDLGESLQKNHKERIVFVPFQTTKELHLDVPADDSAIKFLSF